MNQYQRELEVAKAIAKKAGDVILKYFDAEQEVEIKEDKSFVTVADKLANELAIKELEKEFPDDGVIGEEASTAEYGSGRRWFCDPIDGTAGYVWGTPTAMFSLALVVDGLPVLGVAYDPFLNKLYSGVRGLGSFCNEKKLTVSNLDLSQGILAVTGSVKVLVDLPYIPLLRQKGCRLAAFSGAVYKSCLVARGKLIAYIEHGVNAHDMAAVHVIVEEAGGKISGLKGEMLDYQKPFKGALVSNGAVHDTLLEILQSEKEFKLGE